MSRPVVVLRPEPGNAATVQAAGALGLKAVAAPLFRTVPAAWKVPDATAYAGLLAGSANLFRLGGKGLEALRALPVHAAGEATAAAARAAGFAVAQVAGGGLQPLVSALPPGRYLRLAGEAHVALILPAGVTVDTRVVYAARAIGLPDGVPLEGSVALLHSGEAARQLRDECVAQGLDLNRIALACLAPRIAEIAGAGWQVIEIAQDRTDQALLALARQMCQNL